MASLSCRISPRTSTVIFFDRSPLATAIVTSAMLRTCAVRFEAIELTLSVRSRHTPVTSRTCAWPPSLPSVPTSRATRVTSEVKTESCSIIVLTIVASRRNSPCNGRPSTSSRTVCSRSPRATAVIACVTALVGHRRSSISVLTELSISPQAPCDRASWTRWRVLPSRPTTWPTCASCSAMRWLAATISLNVSAILPASPVQSLGRRTEKSPKRTACSACNMSRRSKSCSVSGPDPCPFEPSVAMIPASIDGGGCTSELISARSWAVGSMLCSFGGRQSIPGAPICITADAIMFRVPLQKCVGRKSRRAASARLGFAALQYDAKSRSGQSLSNRVRRKQWDLSRQSLSAPCSPFPYLPTSSAKSMSK